MGIIHRNNIPNIELIETVISEFANRNDLETEWELAERDEEYPEWRLHKAGYTEQSILVWLNIYRGSIGIFVAPFDEDRNPYRESAAWVIHTREVGYLPEALVVGLGQASRVFGWGLLS